MLIFLQKSGLHFVTLLWYSVYSEFISETYASNMSRDLKKSYKSACALFDDSDQPARVHRVFDVRSSDSQGFNVSSCGKLGL